MLLPGSTSKKKKKRTAKERKRALPNGTPKKEGRGKKEYAHFLSKILQEQQMSGLMHYCCSLVCLRLRIGNHQDYQEHFISKIKSGQRAAGVCVWVGFMGGGAQPMRSRCALCMVVPFKGPVCNIWIELEFIFSLKLKIRAINTLLKACTCSAMSNLLSYPWNVSHIYTYKKIEGLAPSQSHLTLPYFYGSLVRTNRLLEPSRFVCAGHSTPLSSSGGGVCQGELYSLKWNHLMSVFLLKFSIYYTFNL